MTHTYPILQQQYVFIHDSVKEIMERKRKTFEENVYENQGFCMYYAYIVTTNSPRAGNNVQVAVCEHTINVLTQQNRFLQKLTGLVDLILYTYVHFLIDS